MQQRGHSNHICPLSGYMQLSAEEGLKHVTFSLVLHKKLSSKLALQVNLVFAYPNTHSTRRCTHPHNTHTCMPSPHLSLQAHAEITLHIPTDWSAPVGPPLPGEGEVRSIAMATKAEVTAKGEEDQECSPEGRNEKEELLRHIRENSLTVEGIVCVSVREVCVCVCVCPSMCVCLYVCVSV